ncbi:MAG: hypothetical protein R2881_09425 [Eubacteriales bacterium]
MPVSAAEYAKRCVLQRLTDVAEQLGVSYRHLLRSLKAFGEEGLLEKQSEDITY